MGCSRHDQFLRHTGLFKALGLPLILPLLPVLLFLAAACSGGPEPTNSASLEPTPTAVSMPTMTAEATPTTTAPTELVTNSSDPTPTAFIPSPTPEPIVLTIAEGTRARYLVKEQFARRNFPNDAIGETVKVSGDVTFNPDGTIDPDKSSFQADLVALRSDDEERDEFLLEESLESLLFPTAEFTLHETQGMPWPLPREGAATFKLAGDMTIHGITTATTWEVTAAFDGDGAVGQATTSFDFSKFGLERPSAYFLLTVEDVIRLEVDFIIRYSNAAASNPG